MSDDNNERLARLEVMVSTLQNQLGDLKNDMRHVVGRLNRFVNAALWALASFVLGIITWLIKKV